MANAYPANAKLYRNGECKSFSNIMSHTLADDELPGADKGRAVNLIDKALADGWWWTREGRPDKVTAAVLEPADVAPVSVASAQDVDTFDPVPVVAVIDVPIDTIETAPIRRPRRSKR